ncbi:hypothetical protein ACLQ3C_09980 [Gordonia sp. DT30]|uniref:hypothetical protein n=1 Tax=Gordonia sp. DT30 TaxID=3416546 RepID=UPI003CE8F32B
MARTPRDPRPGYRPKVAGSRRSADDTAESVTPEPAPNEEPTVGETAAPETAAPETDTVETTAAEAAVAEPGAAEPVENTSWSSEEAATEEVSPESGTGESGTGKSGADADEADAVESDAVESDVEGATISLTKQTSDAAEPERPAGKTRPVSRVSTIKPQPAAAKRGKTQRGKGTGFSGPGRDKAAAKDRAARNRARRGWFPGLVIAIVAGAAVVLGVVALVLGLHPGASVSANKAFVDQKATTDLTSQAQSKFCTVQAARSKDFDKWVASARAALTGEALTQFNQGVPTIKEQFGQQDVTNDCKVDAVGVRDLSGSSDGSTAQVVLNFVASGTANGTPTQSVIGRYQLGLVKHGDQWVIESYGDI